MARRILIVSLAALALIGGATIADAKKKKPKLQPGPYVGTTSNGIPMTITLDGSRTSGTLTYCDAVAAAFTVTGKTFTFTYLGPDGQVNISVTGTFKPKPLKKGRKGSVSGTMPLSGGCDSTAQTFTIPHQ